MIKIIISVVAALVVTVGALTITGANDMSSAPQPARNDARSPLGASAALAGPREGLGDL
jgi:hypothetical protein